MNSDKDVISNFYNKDLRVKFVTFTTISVKFLKFLTRMFLFGCTMVYLNIYLVGIVSSILSNVGKDQ